MRSTPLNGRYALAGDPREGGAALVYKAADLESDLRHVAVKLLSEQADSRLAPKFFKRNKTMRFQNLPAHLRRKRGQIRGIWFFD